MRLDPNPSFRRIIPPWYDSDALCYALIAVMLGVFFFALVGISVAQADASFSGYMWLPLLLSVLSLWVAVTTSLRLIRRRRRTS